MLKLLHTSTHLICWQSNAQNSPNQASTVHEQMYNFQMYKLGLEKAEESNCQYLLYHEESKGIPEKHLLLLHWICKTFDRVDHNKL